MFGLLDLLQPLDLSDFEALLRHLHHSNADFGFSILRKGHNVSVCGLLQRFGEERRKLTKQDWTMKFVEGLMISMICSMIWLKMDTIVRQWLSEIEWKWDLFEEEKWAGTSKEEEEPLLSSHQEDMRESRAFLRRSWSAVLYDDGGIIGLSLFNLVERETHDFDTFKPWVEAETLVIKLEDDMVSVGIEHAEKEGFCLAHLALHCRGLWHPWVAWASSCGSMKQRRGWRYWKYETSEYRRRGSADGLSGGTKKLGAKGRCGSPFGGGGGCGGKEESNGTVSNGEIGKKKIFLTNCGRRKEERRKGKGKDRTPRFQTTSKLMCYLMRCCCFPQRHENQ